MKATIHPLDEHYDVLITEEIVELQKDGEVVFEAPTLLGEPTDEIVRIMRSIVEVLEPMRVVDYV